MNSPSSAPASDSLVISDWGARLDSFTYYDVLDLPPFATPDEVQVGFHAFCTRFHPDRHRRRAEAERVVIGRIFRRGAEAYRILSDPDARARYDMGLSRGETRASIAVRGAVADPRASVAPKPVRLEDAVRNPAARPFARRAEELALLGDRPQAKLQLSLAMNMDPKNEVLEAFQKTLLEAQPGSTQRPPPVR